MFLSCGRAPWLPRRIGDHDLTWWLKESGFIEATVESLPDPRARLNANVIASGATATATCLRTLHDMGVGRADRLAGGIAGGRAAEDDLAQSLA